MRAWNTRRWLLAMAAVCLGAVAVALVSQHAFDMQPCPWCILQRLIFVVIAVLCIAGAAVTAPTARRALAAGVLLLSACGAAAAIYQHAVAAKSISCNLTLADKILNPLALDSMAPWLFRVTASCADAAVSLLGLPYEYWALLLFVLLGAASVRVLAPRR